ncbi:hypothetical protein SUSAZ_10895 [Sulfolobus acidocaldarius SUSAZ]|nr:hypothetical protein SUSAZ_10895 [Sulfolobus acidocaldarius SUSAZ]
MTMIRRYRYDKRRIRALSGAIVALILVIAGVIIATAVVLFAFGLIPAISNQGSAQVVGTGAIEYAGSGQYNIIITVRNTASNFNVTVSSINIAGISFTINKINNITYNPNNPMEQVGPGKIETLTITATPTSSIVFSSGQTYTATVYFSNGLGAPTTLIYQG